jgi:hypothetical protein
MQRVVRIQRRGAALCRSQLIKDTFHPPASSNPLRPTVGSRYFCANWLTGLNRTRSSSSHRFFRQPRQTQLLIALSAAASIPIIRRKAKEDKEDDVELTLEQSLLDTSEEERRVQTYGINKDRSIFYQAFHYVKITLIQYIVEPVATGLRFIQLVFIFIPVLATIPVIFIGPRIAEYDNERSGTLWWYKFLVRQMERAGATFIKVLLFVLCANSSLDNGPPLEPTSSQQRCVHTCRNSIPTSKLTDCRRRRRLLKTLSTADLLTQYGKNSMIIL